MSCLRSCARSIAAKLAVRELAHRREPGAHAIFGNRENRLLGFVENQVRLQLGLVGGRQNLVRREDQVAQRRLLAHDARVVLDVGGVGQAVDERGDVGRAADFVELSRAGELFLERDEVDRVSPLAQLDHLLEDPAVRVAVEIARGQDLGGLVERVVVDQDGAEDGSLRFEVMRQRPIDSNRFGHRPSPQPSALQSLSAVRRGRRFGFQLRRRDFGLAFGDDPDRHLDDDVGMQLHRHGLLAQLLDRLAKPDLALVDVEALLGERLGDVGRRDRAVERFGLADLAR